MQKHKTFSLRKSITCTMNCNYSYLKNYVPYKHDLFQVYNCNCSK